MVQEEAKRFQKEDGCIFNNKYDNATLHLLIKIIEYMTKIDFKDTCLIKWPALAPNLSPIKNLWSILTKNVYIGGR